MATLSPPTFSTAIYDGSSLLVAWMPSFTPGITVTGYLVTIAGSDGSSIPTTFPGAVTTIGRVQTGALNTAVTYTVTICAQASGVANACTGPYTLVVQQPVLVSVDCDGLAVRMTWTPIPASVSSIVSYQISVFPTGGGNTQSVTIDAPRAASGVILLEKPLTGAYSAQVVASTNYGVQSGTPVVNIATALPMLLTAAYDGVSVSAGWMPPMLPVLPVTSYLLLVSSPDGGSPFSTTVAAGNTNAILPLPLPLTASKRYDLALRAFVAPGISSSSTTRLLVPLPRLTAVDWNGTTLAATWDPVSDPEPPTTQYGLRAYGVGGGSPIVQTIDNPYARSGALASPAFASGVAYQLSVDAMTGLAQAGSVPVGIFTAAPAITGAQFDGALLTVRWTGPASATQPTIEAFEVSVVPANGAGTGRTFTTIVRDGFADAATLDLIGIDPSLAYAVQVSAVAAPIAGTSGSGIPSRITATSAALALVLRTPIVNSVTYDGTRVLVSWIMLPGVSVTNYGIRVTGRDGTTMQSDALPPSDRTGQLTVSSPLSPTGGWTVSIIAQTSGASAASPPLALIAELPVLEAGAFDGEAVQARWTPVLTNDPPVAGYELKAYSSQGGGTGITTVANAATREARVAIPGASTLAYVAQVCAYRGSVSGCSAALPLMQQSTTISSATYDGRHVTAAWTAVSGATAYAVSITAEGASIGERIVTGTTIALAASLDPAQACAVSVRTMIGAATGPAIAMPIITAIPRISHVTTSANSIVLTLDTSAASKSTGVGGYQASLFADGQLVAGPIGAVTAGAATTVTIPCVTTSQARYVVRAQATGTIGAAQAGPLGAAASVISAAPVMIRSGYDGTHVSAAWSAVVQPGITGYAVTIVDTTAGTSQSPIFTVDQGIVIEATLQPSHAYAVSVQAVGGVATGPSSATMDAAANPLARSVGYFFPTSTASQYAYVFRGDIRAPGPNDITVYLPMLFGTPPASVAVDPFTLTLAASPVDPSLPYALSIPQNAAIDVWAFDGNGIRAALRTAYLAFLQQVEAPANGLMPGAMALLRQVIAQALPLTFAETLYYSYGLDATAGYVNLQPGMRLRVDFENRQFVSPDPSGTLSGFVGSGTSYYTLATLAGDSGGPTVFDEFLAQLSVPTVAANVGGGAGAIDLQGSRFQQPYVRLFYPSTFTSSDSGGATGVTQNVALAGAPTIAKLEEATAAYVRNRGFAGVTGIYSTYFRGRAVFIPQIACVIGGNQIYVPVGTTVRQLTQAFAPLPFNQAVPIRGLHYRRAIGNLVDQPSAMSTAFPYARDNDVHFGFQPMTSSRYTGGLDAFDLPVLAGDVLVVGD